MGTYYFYGMGVPQDYVFAHKWFNIAAANGADIGPEMRESVAALMTLADIAEAQRRARECINSGYQGCE